MKIEIGMVVEFNTNLNHELRLGKVVQMLEIKDSINKEENGTIFYMVQEMDRRLTPSKVTEKDIHNVYIKA